MMLLLETLRSGSLRDRIPSAAGTVLTAGGIKQGGTEMAKKPVLTAKEAAAMIPDGATIMCGGFPPWSFTVA